MSASGHARQHKTPQKLMLSVTRLCAGALIAAVATIAMAQRSVPPAEYHAPPTQKAAAAPTLLLRHAAPAHRITLPRPTAAESDAAVEPRASRGASAPLRNKKIGLAIGFARVVPAAEGSLRLSELPWQVTDDGTQATQLTLTSPGAAALRIGLRLIDAPGALRVRFQGSAADAPVFGPVSAATVAADDLYWSPALEGDSGTVEFELPAGVDVGAARIDVPMISHLTASGSSLRAFALNIGVSGACEVDVACLSTQMRQQMLSATNAVAKVMVTVQGSTYLCSGTLLNDSQNSFTPYFLTANHCLEEPQNPADGKGTAWNSAATINTYWFFQAATCGSLVTPDYTLLAGGARLLARSVDFDWALVRLNLAPPNGTTFAAWNADGPIAIGTAADGIHHPSGDLKKVSQGKIHDYETFSDGSSFVGMQWGTGVTEPGSSGSGLFTLNVGNYFEVRGTLSGGSSSCTSPQGVDYYTRFDVAYPLVAQYVAPTAPNPAKAMPVVEYYSAGQNSYFITVDPFEIAGRDNGSPAGWVRTGYRFLAYTDPLAAPAAAKPVCRLYAPPPYGDTRFYSASASECAAMLAQPSQHWISESSAAFYIQVPNASTGICPSNTRAVFRFLDSSSPPRRRYTPEVDLRDDLNDQAIFVQEGAGISDDRAVMCAPLSGAAAPGPAVPNYQGLWWNSPAASESGWGIDFAHQGNTLFATWFTFDTDGKPVWFAITASKTATNVFSGPISRVTGPAFDSVPFNPANVLEIVVGAATFTFADNANATFAYNVNGVAQTKNITRQVFSSPVPTCTWGGQSDLSVVPNYQDLWWAAPAGSESGWGISFTHQGSTIFATWFTYGPDGKPLWLAMSATLTSPNVYAGNLFTATGPAFNAVPFNPANVVETTVGAGTLAFADGNHATFSYNVNGIGQSKQITRQVFAAPGTACF